MSTTTFFPRTSWQRCASIVKHGKDYEVVYELPQRSPSGARQISWRFFRTRREAESFVKEVR